MKAINQILNINDFTLEQKLGFVTGYDSFGAIKTNEMEKCGIRMADGPIGIKSKDKISICLPNTCLMASSWDRELAFLVGQMLGQECNAADVNLALAPAINIKRSPLAGRNFEYYSEDAYLTAKMASKFIQGIQSKNVGICLKHFACNNQEAYRWTQDSIVNEDTLRNIYLRAFELIIEECKVDSIMASYNKVNGISSTQNKFLLDHILRNEWGFDGLVISDWASVGDIVSAMQNGLDLEMPGNINVTLPKLKNALDNGLITEEQINKKIDRLFKFVEKRNDKVKNEDIDEKRLQKIVGESFILLKNNGILPLKKDNKILLIGDCAKYPRIQGGGCASINNYKVHTVLDEMQSDNYNYDFIESYNLSEEELKKSAGYKDIIVFLTLDYKCDSEAFDKKDLMFPSKQLDLLKLLYEYNKNIIVVMTNGSAVDTSFDKYAAAVIETYYGGSYGGGAVVDVLFGRTNPCGKLAETFPNSIDDIPTKDNFGKQQVFYEEGQYIGYRFYNSLDLKPKYEFGYGLSYSNYDLKNIMINHMGAVEFDIHFDITNISNYDGKFVAQIYAKRNSKFLPKLELLEFSTIPLSAKQEKHCIISLNRKHFEKYYGGKKILREEELALCLSSSSQNILFEEFVSIKDTANTRISMDTLFCDLLTDVRYRAIILKTLKQEIYLWAYGEQDYSKDFEQDIFLRNHLYNMPLRGMIYFSQKQQILKIMQDMIEELNAV